MKPTIEDAAFGSITVAGQVFEHDVLIRRGGQVKKRKKKLSLAEAKYIYEPGASRLIIGSGQEGNVHLSREAAAYLGRKQCEVELFPTPEAIAAWNSAEGVVIGLFHVTC
jgi:hypothetical protein